MLVIVSNFYEQISQRLLRGVETEYVRWGGILKNLKVVYVPGALEIPFGLVHFLEREEYQAAVILGCVIRGETDHYQHVSKQSIGHSIRISLEKRVPLGMGILTVENEEQAMQRSGGIEGNKGEECCRVAIQLAELLCT